MGDYFFACFPYIFFLRCGLHRRLIFSPFYFNSLFSEKRKIIFELHPKLKVPKTVLGFIDVPFRRIILTPDFFLPEYDIYVEFWGMIDNEKYKENIFKPKMKIYKSNLIDMISLYPRNLENLERDFHQKLLEIVRDREGNSKEWR